MKKGKKEKQHVKIQDNDEALLWKEKYLRVLADYQNLEKRIESTREDDVRFSTRKVIKKLLPIVDLLNKAQESIQDEGLALVIREFEKILQDEHVVKMVVVGKEFNPETMECVELVEGEHPGRVVDELRVGYSMHEKLIRPAQVRVSQTQSSE